jgi:hypothetical protein
MTTIYSNDSKSTTFTITLGPNFVNSSKDYRANRMRKPMVKQKSPMASERANPRIAYEKSCCFNEGLRAKPISLNRLGFVSETL